LSLRVGVSVCVFRMCVCTCAKRNLQKFVLNVVFYRMH
jgi:hypothetical protein